MILGEPIIRSFRCRDQNKTLFDPPLVEVSLLKGNGIEAVLRYGGGNATDAQLTRTSTGVYRFWYQSDVIGQWRVVARWVITSSPQSIVLITRLYLVNVDPIPNTFVRT